MFGLALTIAALAATATATGYSDGQEYVYAYKGSVYSGYPYIKDQYSGYAFKANLIVQPHGDYAVLKVDHVEKAQFNGEFEDVRNYPHNYAELPEQDAGLTTPFKVFRKNGIINHFEVAKGEPAFTVNMKRGLIGLFNLNFEDAEAAPSTENNDISHPDPDRHFYKLYEKGMLGDCETAYIIEHHPYYKYPDHKILNVTKIKDYHKCKTIPNQVYGVFHGHECGEADHEHSHTLHGNAQTKYDIRGGRHDYVIEHLVSVGEVAYTPYPLEGQTVTTKITRHLDLKEEHAVTAPLVVSEDVDSYDSLVYEFGYQHDFSEPVDLHKPHYLYNLVGRKTDLDIVKAQFDELTHVYEDATYHENIKDKNFPEKFLQLTKYVGTLGYEDIETLYNTYADIPKQDATAEQKRARGLFLDTLISVGTNPALLFGKYLIDNKKVKIQEAAYFFTQVPIHVKEVSESLLHELQEMCESESVKKHQSAQISCIFALSTIIHDHCVARYHPEGQIESGRKTCQPSDVIKYFEYVIGKFEQTEDETLKIAFLKAAGIIGLREIIPHLRPYIEGAHHSNLYLRSQAVWSIVNVGWRFQDRVKDLLVPLLFNQTEHYELRLAAYIILMKYRPQLYAIEGIARALKYDKDDQVRSYVYHHLSSLANSTHACDRQLSHDAEYALRIFHDVHDEFDRYDYSFSNVHYSGGHDEHYDLGGSTKFAYLASDTGYIPRSMYLGFEDFFGGKSFESFSLGFKQYGLDKFFDKIFGPEGTFGKRSVFDLFKKRGKRDASGVEKELNEIKGKINLPHVEYEPIHGEIFLKYMGNTVKFFHFDDHTFEDFFREGRFTIPNLPATYQKIPEFYYQRFMLNVDKMYVFPTESGVPVFFDYKQPLYLHVHNKESSFKVEQGFFPEERGGKWPEHIKVETDSHIAIDKNLFAYSGVVIPFDQVIFGAGINRRVVLSLPLKVKADLDVKEKQINFKWTPIDHQVVHFKYQPHTFIDSYANNLPQTLEKEYHPVTRLSHKQVHNSFFQDTLGFGFNVDASYEHDNSHGSWKEFVLEKNFREKFYYLYANPNFEPYNIDVNFDHTETKEVQASIKYHFYDHEYSPEEFSGLGFEDYHITDTEHAPFYANSLEVEVEGHGDKERKIHTAFSWTRDLKRTQHKVNLFYDRTPFSSDETEHFKICASGKLEYPQYDPSKLIALDTLGMDHKVHEDVKIHFGKDCSTDQKILVKKNYHTTDEQIELESKRDVPDTPEHYNPYAHLYQECLKEREHGMNYGEHCYDYIDLVTTVKGMDYDVKFEHLSPSFLNLTYRTAGLLQHFLYDYAVHNELDVHNPENELHIHADFHLTDHFVDIKSTKPHSRSLYTHVPYECHTPFRSLPPFEEIHIKNSLSDVYCKLEGDNVLTFDHYEYDLPQIDCQKVIAKDCSKGELFTILGTKINHPKYQKAVKVFLGKHKVEALPVSDDSDIIVRVDGKRVPLSASEPYLHYESEDHTVPPDFYVTYRGFYYAIHSEKYGVIVEYDGHAIIVQVSPYYRHKVCGLCGNYNGQKYDGMTNEQGCYFEDEKAYAYAFAIPSDTCSAIPHPEPICPSEHH